MDSLCFCTSCEEALTAFDLDIFQRIFVEQTALEHRNSVSSGKEGKFDGGQYDQEDVSLWEKGLLSNPGSSLRFLSYNATSVCARWHLSLVVSACDHWHMESGARK